MKFQSIKNKLIFQVVSLAFLFGVTSCKNKSDSSRFTQLSANHSGIGFENTIVETPEINILTYEYAYNGGGVAAGDFNNDGLCDLYFSGNQVSNKLYINKGNLEFKDITEKAKVSGRRLWKTGVTTIDINADGWLDLYVCYSGPEVKQSLSNELYINQGCEKGGEPTFKESAIEYGLDAPETYSTQASFFDYDLDGDLDMFLINHATHFYSPFNNTNKLRNTRHPNYGNRLYRNDFKEGEAHSHFIDVSTEAGIHGGVLNFGLGVSISDLNADGWPDIYVTNDYEEQDFLYINNKNGTFTEVSKKALGHSSRNGRGTDIADFNNDLLPDIMEVDKLPEDNYRQKLLKGPDDFNKYQLLVDSGFQYQQMRNTLQLNRGVLLDGTPVFSEVGQLAGVSNTDWSWAPLFLDVNNDGLKDLFVSNGHLREFTNMDFLKFGTYEAQQKAKAENRELAPYELVSKMPSAKTSDYLFMNLGNLTFKDMSKESGIQLPNLSFGSTYADLDNDGDLEIITNNTNEKSMIWINHTNEIEQSHYLKVKLKGTSFNPSGIGAKIVVRCGGFSQLQEVYNSRGFQSSVESILQFGLGKNELVESIKVTWPDGLVSILPQVKADQLIEVMHQDAIKEIKSNTINDPLFEIVSDSTGIDFVHKEKRYPDFNREPLLMYQLSRLGPPLAKGDVDNDGNEDFYIGGATGQSGKLYLSNGKGKFDSPKNQPWEKDKACEDTGATFFDADGDNDLDLFVVSGGNEFKLGADEYIDRLYINQGKGNFIKVAEGSTIIDHVSGSCVAAADYDKDGDLDLYVGGSALPSKFPYPSPGAILKNETDPKTKKIKFVLATKEVNSDLREPGTATDALWTDYNNDGWVDLMLVGHWMPIRIFENKKGTLVENRSPSLTNTGGFWNKILADDFDADGDVDYIIGNAGINLPFKASEKKPMTLYYTDIDDDGKIDPIICNYVQSISYPIASRDELLSQVNLLRRKFKNYELYANATIEDVIEPYKLQGAKKLTIHTFASIYLENLGNGNFSIHQLPIEAQFSAVQGILSGDYNYDGHKDLFIAGNFFPYRTQYGPSDSSIGLLLAGDNKGNFTPLSLQQSGICMKGDIRSVVELKSKSKDTYIIAGANNEKNQVLKSRTK